MNRQAAPSDDVGYDTEVNALLADLEASIASFDDRMEQRRREENHVARSSASVNTFPEVDPEAVFSNVAKQAATTPIATPATLLSETDDHPHDLLSELRSAVNSRSETEQRDSESDAARRQRFSTVLRAAFDYFHELTQHLNALRPKLPCSYALAKGAELMAPEWQRGNAHARSPANDEFHLVDSLVVRGTCLAASDLAVACPRHQAPTLRHEMAVLNIQILDEDERSDAARVRFVLSREIRVQMQFSCDFEADSILIHARNVGGFGLAAYAVSPELLTRDVLNMLGEQILGRRRVPPPAFKPIPFSQGLGNK